MSSSGRVPRTGFTGDAHVSPDGHCRLSPSSFTIANSRSLNLRLYKGITAAPLFPNLPRTDFQECGRFLLSSKISVCGFQHFLPSHLPYTSRCSAFPTCTSMQVLPHADGQFIENEAEVLSCHLLLEACWYPIFINGVSFVGTTFRMDIIRCSSPSSCQSPLFYVSGHRL